MKLLTRLRDQSGLALIATILVLALVAALAATAINAAMSSLRASGLAYRDARAFYAAEAGGEYALAQIKTALQDGVLSAEDLENIHPPSMDGFSFDSFSVGKLGEPVVETITDGPYAGLYSLTQNVEVYAQAEDPTGNVSAILMSAKAQAIPIFQFGVFFEGDLEATNGPPMEFAGRVHSNGNIYLSSPNAWYREMVTTPRKVFLDRKDNHEVLYGIYINDAEGNEVQLKFDSRSTPDPEAFKAESCSKFDCRLQTDAFEVQPLHLPLPAGLPAYELMRPKEASDTDAERQIKYAWKADMYVTVDLTDILTASEVCGGSGPTTPWPRITVERTGSLEVPDADAKCDIFRWRWSAFYDGREEELKDVLDIDIDQLELWVASSATRATQVLYVEFIVPGSIASYNQQTRDLVPDATLDPAIRLVHGRTLPNPMTVAAEWPLYTLGDYNSVSKKPASLAADGITILSTAWEDDENRPEDSVFGDCEGEVAEGHPCDEYEDWAEGWSKNYGDETTVQAGIIAGNWPTVCDHEEPGCPGGYDDFYGGGLESFPRFLENWRGYSAGIAFHYLGALISPFTSQKTTGTWNGTYFSPPVRDWRFDLDFRNPELLPPATPNVGVVLRTGMREAL